MHICTTRILCAVVFMFAAVLAAGSPADALELRFAHGQPPQSITNQAAEHFKKQVETATNGDITIAIFPAGQLGTSVRAVEGVRLGTIDLTAQGNPFFTRFNPEMNVLDLPYLFEGGEHVRKVMDGEIGRKLLDSLEKFGVKGLAFWEIGFRNITTASREVRKPEDLKGLKIRTTPNPAHLKAFELLGANPTPISFNEVYMALQTGTVDGQENPVWIIYANRFNEVQKHLSLTRHAYTAQVFAMNLAKFNALTPAQQETVLKAAQEAAVMQREGMAKDEAKNLEALKKAGMQVVEDIDHAPFRATVYEPVMKEYVDKFGPETVDAILKLRK